MIRDAYIKDGYFRAAQKKGGAMREQQYYRALNVEGFPAVGVPVTYRAGFKPKKSKAMSVALILAGIALVGFIGTVVVDAIKAF